ncbi:MAG: hypothetical protein AB7S78_00855 [Candidatus Omnitrophota bacterium]
MATVIKYIFCFVFSWSVLFSLWVVLICSSTPDKTEQAIDVMFGVNYITIGLLLMFFIIYFIIYHFFPPKEKIWTMQIVDEKKDMEKGIIE